MLEDWDKPVEKNERLISLKGYAWIKHWLQLCLNKLNFTSHYSHTNNWGSCIAKWGPVMSHFTFQPIVPFGSQTSTKKVSCKYFACLRRKISLKTQVRYVHLRRGTRNILPQSRNQIKKDLSQLYELLLEGYSSNGIEGMIYQILNFRNPFLFPVLHNRKVESTLLFLKL